MSLWRDDAASPRPVQLCVAALGLLSILSLERVFASSSYLSWAIPAAAVGATFALTFGRRSLLLGFGLLGGVTALTLPALFARDATAYLFPTPASVRTVSTLLSSGLSGMMREAAPVPASPRYLIVLWTAALAGGFLGASWIVVERPIGAVATSLGTIAYAGSVGKGPGRGVYGFFAAVLLSVFLLLDGRHRISSWSRALKRISPTLGVPTLALASLIGLAGPAVLGAARPWVNVQSALRPRVVLIKPLADIRKQLQTTPPVEVMKVTSSIATYWRLTALTKYTGREWLLEAKPVAVRGGRVPPAGPPTKGAIVAQDFEITTLLAPWLPAAYAAREADVALPFEVDRDTSTLLLKNETVPGLKYKAVSRVPDTASPSTRAEPLGKPDRDAELFAQLARPIVGTDRTPWQQAVALQNHFRRFRYDEKVDGGHTVARLQRFLNDRTGYCEQFAATMSLMLRGLGTPARVGVGFLPGGKAKDGKFVVSTKDAHAWVEAHIPDMGWVAFDPTPGRGLPSGGRDEEQEQAAQPTPVPAAAEPTPSPSLAPGETASPASDPLRLPLGRMALLALALGAIPGAKAVRRTMRRSGSAGEMVNGAYAEFVDRVADLGWRARPFETHWECWRRVFRTAASPGASPAADVVRIAAFSVYGPRPPSADEAENAWRRLDLGLRALRRSLPWWRRVTALYDPRTLVPRGSPAAQLTGA